MNLHLHTAIKQSDSMISKMAKQVRKQMKFGINILPTYEEAVTLDKKNGNTLWQDTTKKEINNVEIAFKFLDDGFFTPWWVWDIVVGLTMRLSFPHSSGRGNCLHN